MPKVVKTAAEILGTEKVPAAPAAEPTPAETQPSTPAPVVKIAEPVAPSPTTPPAGFETPPPSEPPVEENVSGLPVALPPRPFTPPPAPAASAPESLLSNAKARSARPVVLPEPVVTPAAPAAPAADAPKEFRFVKNVHPGEVIIFEDGSTLTFPGTVFTTKDPELAAKILAVANRHHIVQ